jgi:thiosulfate dehydrogenase [quinone] large subunit
MSDVTSAGEPTRPSSADPAGWRDGAGARGESADRGEIADQEGTVDGVETADLRESAADAAGPALEEPAGESAGQPSGPPAGQPAGELPGDPPGISPITRAERRAAEARAAAEQMGPGYFPGGFGHLVWALTRLIIGFVFLWAFLDKLLGLGRNTPKARSWLEGGSPTTGYLSAVDGPVEDVFHRLAGREWADWLFMVGLAGIGLALILGIGVTIAAITGALLLLAMWLTSLPIDTNPFVDDHLVYALVIIGIAVTGVGLRYSLAPWWRRTRLVRKLKFLR